MIKSFRSKALKQYHQTEDSSKLPSTHLKKIRRILTRLEAADNPEMMREPGYDLHPLKGDLADFWSVKVNGNYRIIFRFEGENAYDVDYLDYH